MKDQTTGRPAQPQPDIPLESDAIAESDAPRGSDAPEKTDLPVKSDATAGDAPEEGVPAGEAAPVGSPAHRRARLVTAWVVTGLAALLVVVALVAPSELRYLTPAGFLRVPVEGLLGLALLVALPSRARRVAAVIAGLLFGLLLIWKIIDIGFRTALARPFDPVFDWSLLRAAAEFVGESDGQFTAVAAVIGALVLALAVLVLTPLAVLRLSRVVARHRTAAIRGVVVLGVVWAVCALLSVQIVPGLPVATHHYDRVSQFGTSLLDRGRFAAEAAVDDFRDVPGEELLTALRGKDVLFAFVESYGRDAVTDPELAAEVGAVLADGEERLRAAGFSYRCAYLTSPTVGGASWLAHATLLSGLWVNNQQRYRMLVEGDRMILNHAFDRAGWRTVGMMPALIRAWPEGEFFGYDRLYSAEDLGYQGPRVSYGPMPDQYTLAAFERLERAPSARPVMAEIPLISSHAPWTPVPPLIDWDEVGDGAVFETVDPVGPSPEAVLADPEQARTQYRRAIAYTLSALTSYIEHYGDEDLVVVFLGDHQPSPLVTGEGASHDVPISIVAGDPAVTDQISDWGWQDCLRPDSQAPVWRMDTFRDRFLTAFGPE